MPTSLFSVNIIESPSTTDLLQGRSEGDILRKILELAGIPCSYSLAADFDCFGVAVLAHYLPKAFFPNQGPLASVIHISAHGDKDGFVLTSGQRVLWGQLAGLLRPINRAFAGRLILAMSTCEGLHGVTMALSNEDLPFYAIVGHVKKPSWTATAIGYATFYNLLSIGKNLAEALTGMQTATGDHSFEYAPGSGAQQFYAQSLAGVDEQEILNNLTASVAQARDQWLKGTPPDVLEPTLALERKGE